MADTDTTTLVLDNGDSVEITFYVANMDDFFRELFGASTWFSVDNWSATAKLESGEQLTQINMRRVVGMR